LWRWRREWKRGREASLNLAGTLLHQGCTEAKGDLIRPGLEK